jgi:hypothetical protein
MQMADDTTNLLAPFDEETQVLLLEVDAACSLQMQQLMEKINQAALAGDED